MDSSMLTKVFTLASFASVLFLASIPGQVSALSADHLVVRSPNHAHAGIAKKRATNSNSKRCKVKSASLSSTHSVSSTATKAKTSSAAKGRATTSPSGGGGDSGGGGGSSAPAVPHSGKLGLVFGGSPDQLYNFGAHRNMA